jgi:hypothetical protein
MHVLRRASEPTFVWITALASSLAFLLTGPYSNFAPVGFLDPWYYTGYFLHFRYLVHTFGPTYYVSRLPWILPGLAAFHLAPPEAASVILNLAIVSVSAVSLYWAVRWFYGAPAGATAAVLLVTNPYFMSTVCWDYPNGPSIAYAFAALAFAVRPNGARLVNSALVGVLLALSGLTHLSAASMLVAIAAIPLWRYRHNIREILRECAYMAAGAAAVVLALCPVSQLLIGRWTYFYWQIYFAMRALPYSGTGLDFLLTSHRLLAPALLLIFGPFIVRRVRKNQGLAWRAWLALLICLALFAFQEFVMHVFALRLPYTSSYILVPLLFFAGVLLGEFLTTWLRAAIAVAAALILPWTFSLWAWPQHPWTILILTGAVALAAIFIRQPHLAPVALSAVLFLSPALDPSIAYAWDRPTPPRGPNRNAFRDLMTFDAMLQSSSDPSRKLRFWFDRDEPAVTFYDSAESLYLWIPFDDLEKQITANTTLVHLTIHPDRIPSRLQLLASHGIRVGNERQRSMQYQGATVYIILQDVQSVHASETNGG